MPKRPDPGLFSGSLQKHWFQYITKWEMKNNYKDAHATRYLT